MVAVAVPIPMYNYLISRRRGALDSNCTKFGSYYSYIGRKEMLSLSWEKCSEALRRVSSILFWEFGVWKRKLIQPVRPSRICLRHSIPLTH